MSTGFEGQVESHKHTFAVADLGDFDLDEDSQPEILATMGCLVYARP